MKKTALSLALALVFVPVFSQDVGVLSDILKKTTVSFIDFSWLVASQTGMECTPFEAWTRCDRFGTFPFKSPAGQPITVKDVSHFFMLNYGLKGGILWTNFRNGRYAWKELESTGFWDPKTDPDDTLSGRDLVRAVSRFFTLHPDAQLGNPPATEAALGRKNALLALPEAVK